MAGELVPWDARMCFDLALGVEATEDVLARYLVSREEYEAWSNNPLFTRTIGEFQKHIRENGLGFKAKARIQAEDLLDVGYSLAHNKDVPPSVRADLIKWIAKMADLEPKQSATAVTEEFTKKAMGELLDKMSDGDLELRVMQVLSKKAAKGETYDAEILKINDTST